MKKTFFRHLRNVLMLVMGMNALYGAFLDPFLTPEDVECFRAYDNQRRARLVPLPNPLTLDSLRETVREMNFSQEIQFERGVKLAKEVVESWESDKFEEDCIFACTISGFYARLRLEDLERPIWLQLNGETRAEMEKNVPVFNGGFLKFCLDLERSFQRLENKRIQAGGFVNEGQAGPTRWGSSHQDISQFQGGNLRPFQLDMEMDID